MANSSIQGLSRWPYIYDAYTANRGNPQMLALTCKNCSNWFMDYQKDGPGPLLRLYLDRVFEPQELRHSFSVQTVQDAASLKCTSCLLDLCKPIVYKKDVDESKGRLVKEERAAFEILTDEAANSSVVSKIKEVYGSSGPTVSLLETSLQEMSLDARKFYAAITQYLICYKDNKMTIFYGGPIHRAEGGAKEIMVATFEGADYRIRSYYEIVFVGCSSNSAEGAPILFVDVPDVNIKFKNLLSDDYKKFSDLCAGNYMNGRYVIIRAADIGIPFYPTLYLKDLGGERSEEDKARMVGFLHTQYRTQQTIADYHLSKAGADKIVFQNQEEIRYKPIPLSIRLGGKAKTFYLQKHIFYQDPWKVYYIVARTQEFFTKKSNVKGSDVPLMRIDSGCLIGQIYGDDACDCLDQLHEALVQISEAPSERSFIFHAPLQDGRGYGTCPKGETEIYKLGGHGQVHETPALNTIAAAQLLYGAEEYIDIRKFMVVGLYLQKLGIKKIEMFTDNREKVEAVERVGIEILRRPTETNKESCAHHIKAKHGSRYYYHSPADGAGAIASQPSVAGPSSAVSGVKQLVSKAVEPGSVHRIPRVSVHPGFNPNLFAITGPPTSGKSTLVANILSTLRRRNIKVGGIFCSERRDPVQGNWRTGFSMHLLYPGKEDVEVLLATNTPQSGAEWRQHAHYFYVNVANVNQFAVPALEQAYSEAEVVVVDEAASMQFFSDGFKRFMKKLIKSKKPALVTIPIQSSEKIVKKIEKGTDEGFASFKLDPSTPLKRATSQSTAYQAIVERMTPRAYREREQLGGSVPQVNNPARGKQY